VHKMNQAAGQRGGIIGAGYDVPGIDVSPRELLVHVTGGLLVLETMISAGTDTLQADWLRWEEDRVVQEGNPGRGVSPARADSNGDSNGSDQRHATANGETRRRAVFGTAGLVLQHGGIPR
jgi:hypothetical protein